MSLHRIERNSDDPNWMIIEHLQRNDGATIKDLRDLLGVTTTAVRRYILGLQSEGYVERRRVTAGVGRPHHVYYVTAKASELFACHCDDLALTLLEEVFEVEGKERTTMLLDRVSTRLANSYRVGMRATDLQGRVEELAGALQDRGVLTDVVNKDDVLMLQTFNCPYHELAHEYREICEMDQALIEKALGADVSLTACMVDGDTSCSFVVTNNQSSSQPLP